MNRQLSEEQEKRIVENRQFVHYYVQKAMRITLNHSEYEDIISIGNIGLTNAAITFDATKNRSFLTYAGICIRNEIAKYFQKENKHRNVISLDEPVGRNKYHEESDRSLEDLLEDTSSNFVENLMNEEKFLHYVSIILNCLKGTTRIVNLYRIGNQSPLKIAQDMHMTKANISLIKQKTKQVIRRIIDNHEPFQEVFKMAIVGEEYRITFSTKDVENFNKIFANFLKCSFFAEKIPDFKVSAGKERIVIQIPAHPESFCFLAQLIQEMDEYSMAFVSGKGSVEDNSETEKKDTVKKSEIVKAPVKRHPTTEQVRNYMLSLDSFELATLKRYFQDKMILNSVVTRVVYEAKKEGLISSIGRGQYIVNK